MERAPQTLAALGLACGFVVALSGRERHGEAQPPARAAERCRATHPEQVLVVDGRRADTGIGRVYVEKPDNGADWGVRFVVTLLFPK